MSQAEFTYNTDRWMIYVKQRLGIRTVFQLGNVGREWPRVTPKQRRRLIHKARKNNDRSTGNLRGK